MQSPDGHKVFARYTILHEGDVVGRLQSRRAVGKWRQLEAVTVTDEIDIKVESFWNNYSVHSLERMVLTDAGLVHYSGLSVEDGQRSSVEANLTERSLEMRVEEEGENFESHLDRSLYDASSEDAAAWFIGSGKASQVLRVIDLDDFEVVETKYRYEGEDELHIAGMRFAGRVVSFRNNRKKGRQWFTVDNTGTWLLKEIGTDEDGQYSIILTEYARGFDSRGEQ